MGGFNKKTIKDISLENKRVLMRADYNVPVKNGRISDDYRIKQSLPTIEYILKQKGTRVIIMSHLGRPASRTDKQFSLRPVADHLSKLLDRKVRFAPDCIGDDAKLWSDHLGEHEILLLENLRFHPEEEQNQTSFAKELISVTGAQLFVQDGFGVVHRAHASTEAITHLLPSVAGLLLEKEVSTIQQVIKDPKPPVVSVIGGAKISDKIEVINKLVEISDCVAVVGAMANNFLLAGGHNVGKSLIEKDALGITKKILSAARAEEKKRNFNFLLPVDCVVSSRLDGRTPIRVVDFSQSNLAEINSYPKLPPKSAYSVGDSEIILDIGPSSSAQIAGAIKMANTVIWNGTCGVTETPGLAGADPPFSHGTKIIVEAMMGASNHHANKPFTFVGGGDTVSYVEEQKLTSEFGFVSTGGGASLELISGHKLPGVESLESKK